MLIRVKMMSDEDKELEETVEAVETLGDVAEVAGAVNVAAGVEDIATAAEIEDVSKGDQRGCGHIRSS
jgi:hypothetical protein